MEITASLVKDLRERTGAGMMECKKALTANNGDIDVSAEWLRKQGLAKADKKADRVAAEGRIAVAQAGGKAVLVEINSETDFVAKDVNFLAFTDAVAQAALASGANDVEVLKAAKLPSGETVEEARAAAIAKLGENILIRRIAHRHCQQRGGLRPRRQDRRAGRTGRWQRRAGPWLGHARGRHEPAAQQGRRRAGRVRR